MRFSGFAFILFLLITGSAIAQNGRPPVAGAQGMAMGNSSITLQGINSAFGNQAGLAYLESFEVSLFGQQRFLINDLGDYAIAAAYPTNSGVFGVSFQYYGIEAYNEQKVGLAYARKLIDKLSIGAQIDFLSTRIPEYGNNGLLTFEIGFHSQLTKELAIAGHIFSPMRVNVTEEEELPSYLKFGLSYSPAKQLLVVAEFVKHIDYDISFHGGIEYLIYKSFYLRAGFQTQPSQMTFGLGFYLENGLKIDLASSYHSTLGISPGIGIRYALAKK